MPGFHISTGRDDVEKPRVCDASTVESCPFYKDNGAAHGATVEEAWTVHEEQLTNEAGGSFGKLSKKKKKKKKDNEAGEGTEGFDIFASLARIQTENSDADFEDTDNNVPDADDNKPTRPSAPPLASDRTIFGGNVYKGYAGTELFDSTDERVFEDKSVGVYATKNEGLLTANGAFNASTVHGLIDYSRLQEGDDSRVFGFTEIESYEPYMLHEFNTEDEYSYSDMTNAEYDQLNKDEKQAMNAFTGNDFLWINDRLYGKNALVSARNESDIDDDSFEAVTATMDSAISKGPKKQRFLYRSVKGEDTLFNDPVNGPMTANDWLSASESRLGTEVSFAGYQSTSNKTDGVKKFSRDNGVIVEILSPEGVSVATNSEYQDEYEVVLPRNQRYMVVGAHKHVDIDFPQTHHTAYRDSADNMTVIRLVAINDDGEVLDGTNSDDIRPWTA